MLLPRKDGPSSLLHTVHNFDRQTRIHTVYHCLPNGVPFNHVRVASQRAVMPSRLPIVPTHTRMQDGPYCDGTAERHDGRLHISAWSRLYLLGARGDPQTPTTLVVPTDFITANSLEEVARKLCYSTLLLMIIRRVGT